jgi:hypothetical protein
VKFADLLRKAKRLKAEESQDYKSHALGLLISAIGNREADTPAELLEYVRGGAAYDVMEALREFEICPD